jgi:hypothetical protein
MANTLKDHINKLNAAHTSAADSDNPVRAFPTDSFARLHFLPCVVSCVSSCVVSCVVCRVAQVYQIVEILNAHLHSLQWVEDNSNQLHSKLKTLRTQFKAHQDQQDHLRRIRNDYYYH